MTKKWPLLTAGLAGGIGALAWWFQKTPAALAPAKPNPELYHYSNQPTIVLHGSGGSGHSTIGLINQLHADGVATRVLTITVDVFGKLHVKGDWDPKQKNNPIIQVIFQLTYPISLKQEVNWFEKILEYLQSNYQVESYNIIGHSYGASVAIYQALHQTPLIPQLKKVVLIASSFNKALLPSDHLLKTGEAVKFDQDYQAILNRRDHFPSDVDILNIYGNVEAKNTDLTVPNPASQVLRYLLGPKAHSYQEFEFTSEAKHSELLTNQAVIDQIIKFLYQK